MENAQKSWDEGGRVQLYTIVSKEDASFIAKHIGIPLLNECSQEEQNKFGENYERDYFRWSVKEIGGPLKGTPTLVFQDCQAHLGSSYIAYCINLRTGNPTVKSDIRTPLPDDIRTRLCNRTKVYYNYVNWLNRPQVVPDISSNEK
jgi:hypothetical protein